MAPLLAVLRLLKASRTAHLQRLCVSLSFHFGYHADWYYASRTETTDLLSIVVRCIVPCNLRGFVAS